MTEIEDYCAFFANACRKKLKEAGTTIGGAVFLRENVFDQTDPDRRWFGAPTVEVAEGDRERTYFVDSSFEEKTQLELLVRTETRAQCVAATRAFERRVVAPLLCRLEDEGTIGYWKIDSLNYYPDERGVVIGESFRGALAFTITKIFGE